MIALEKLEYKLFIKNILSVLNFLSVKWSCYIEECLFALW